MMKLKWNKFWLFSKRSGLLTWENVVLQMVMTHGFPWISLTHLYLRAKLFVPFCRFWFLFPSPLIISNLCSYFCFTCKECLISFNRNSSLSLQGDVITCTKHIANKLDTNTVVKEGKSLLHSSAFIRITCTDYHINLRSQTFFNNSNSWGIHCRQASEGPSAWRHAINTEQPL